MYIIGEEQLRQAVAGMTSSDTAGHLFWACVAQMGYTTMTEFIFDVVSTHSYLSKELGGPVPVGHMLLSKAKSDTAPVVFNVFRDDDDGDYIDRLIEECFQSMMDLLVDYGHYPLDGQMDEVMSVIRMLLVMMRSYVRLPANSHLNNCMMILHRRGHQLIMSLY